MSDVNRSARCAASILFAILLALSGCTDRPARTPAPTTSVPNNQPTQAVVPAGGVATVTPTTAAATIPAGVLAAIEVVESGDLTRIGRLIQFSNMPCTKELGSGGPPKCGPDEVAGGQVEVFEYDSCERPSWIRRPMLEAVLAGVFSHPFARYAVFAESVDYVAVFQARDAPVVGAGVAAVIKVDRVVALLRTCGAGDTASALIPRGQSTFLLKPPGR